MFRKLGLAVLILVVAAGLPSRGFAVSPSVTLTPSVASPQPLGTPVSWTAAVQNAPTGHTYDYQFTVTFNGQAQITQDFSQNPTFPWVPHTVEGAYQVSVITRDITTSPFVPFAPVSANFTLQSLLTGGATQAVNPTAHPLVALFTGPPCMTGHQLLVRFHPANSQASMTTNLIPCSTNTANFLIAGMYPSTQYLMHWEEYDGALVNTGADLSFTTGAIPSSVPVPTITTPVKATPHDAALPVILWHFLGFDHATATDLAGKMIWYSLGAQLVRMDPGGNFYAFGVTGGAFNGGGTLTQYDLAGNQVIQTNLEILNEQLAAKGFPALGDFNGHEARTLPNGNILLLGSIDEPSTTAQGGTPSNPIDIISDMVLVLDHNMQLLWAWNAFDHEDVTRRAILNETCAHGQGGCPNFNANFTIANDWLHTNSAQMTADGNIIISQRHQDWVIKIDYANGTGDGHVIWRMGPAGDFTILNPPSQNCGDTNDVFPWFTHQHDAAFQFDEGAAANSAGTVMTVFDDGDTRAAKCSGTQNSRGMVLFVNETARQVYIETQGDLGTYSAALGSGQLFAPGDGNLYSSYGNGDLPHAAAQATEINLAGQIVYQAQANSLSYRIYRMPNLYTPTLPFTATGVYPQTPNPLEFGTIPFGTTEVIPMTVANFGLPGTANVGGSVEGLSFKVLATAQNTCQAGLTAGESCTLPVAFTPASVGAHHELLILEDAAATSPGIELDGIATAGPPVAHLSTIYLPFGNVPMGTSKTLSVTVSNTGVGTLTVAPSITGSTNYTIAANTCGAGVVAGGSCTLQVQFTPGSIAVHDGVLTLQTNGTTNPTVGLAGTGAGLSVFGGVSFAPLQFGSVANGSTKVLPLTVTNIGLPGTVTIGTAVTVGMSSTPTTTYVILTTSQNTCLAGIAAGQSCTLPVEFVPAGSGTHDDVLTLTANPSGGASSSAVWLLGTTP